MLDIFTQFIRMIYLRFWLMLIFEQSLLRWERLLKLGSFYILVSGLHHG